MINYALIGRKLLHPVKVDILSAFTSQDGAVALSPNELSKRIDQKLGTVSYHVKDLAGLSTESKFADSPLLKLVDTAQRRGALEHFYALTNAALAAADIDAAEGEGRR